MQWKKRLRENSLGSRTKERQHTALESQPMLDRLRDPESSLELCRKSGKESLGQRSSISAKHEAASKPHCIVLSKESLMYCRNYMAAEKCNKAMEELQASVSTLSLLLELLAPKVEQSAWRMNNNALWNLELDLLVCRCKHVTIKCPEC